MGVPGSRWRPATMGSAMAVLVLAALWSISNSGVRGQGALPQEKNVPAELEKSFAFPLHLDVPGKEELFRLESEDALRERIRLETMKTPLGKLIGPAEFPDPRIRLSTEVHGPRNWTSLSEYVEPNYVGYRRLYFEQKNLSRYGWDLGMFSPLISAGAFYFDLVTFPLQFIAEPRRRFEFNTGFCLPGDPVPLLLYPPRPK
jgi:hypothetical protein